MSGRYSAWVSGTRASTPTTAVMASRENSGFGVAMFPTSHRHGIARAEHGAMLVAAIDDGHGADPTTAHVAADRRSGHGRVAAPGVSHQVAFVH